jgi:hypothetical protein
MVRVFCGGSVESEEVTVTTVDFCKVYSTKCVVRSRRRVVIREDIDEAERDEKMSKREMRASDCRTTRKMFSCKYITTTSTRTLNSRPHRDCSRCDDDAS